MKISSYTAARLRAGLSEVEDLVSMSDKIALNPALFDF